MSLLINFETLLLLLFLNYLCIDLVFAHLSLSHHWLPGPALCRKSLGGGSVSFVERGQARGITRHATLPQRRDILQRWHVGTALHEAPILWFSPPRSFCDMVWHLRLAQSHTIIVNKGCRVCTQRYPSPSGNVGAFWNLLFTLPASFLCSNLLLVNLNTYFGIYKLYIALHFTKNNLQDPGSLILLLKCWWPSEW